MEFAPSEHEPCVRCLQLGTGLCEPDFVGARVDGEEEIALMDDVPILEVYSGQRAADLGAQLNLLDRGKLTKEAQSGINLALGRLAHDDLRKGRRGNGGGSVFLTVRIGDPCSHDDNGQGRNCPSKQRASGDVLRCHRNRSTVKSWAYTQPADVFRRLPDIELDFHDRAVRLPSAVIESCLPGTVARLADAYFRRVRSLAAGPAAKAYSGSLIGRPVARSTRIGSTASPVLVLTSSTLAPSGAKCLLPQANNATTTGRKSRPRAVRTYS